MSRDIKDRGDIERFVRAFYRAAAMDDLLGPVFAAAPVDWPTHIARLTDFWAWQLLGIRGYTGNPLRAHEPVHARIPFTDAHYDRWLELFEDAIDALHEGPVASLAKQRAHKMAHALQRLLAGESASGNAGLEPLWTRRP